MSNDYQTINSQFSVIFTSKYKIANAAGFKHNYDKYTALLNYFSYY